MDGVTAIGLVGAVCTTSSFLPQVIKSWRTKQTQDLSLGMYALMTCGMVLWLVYGILRSDLALILSNAVSLALAASVLYLKLKYGRRA